MSKIFRHQNSLERNNYAHYGIPKGKNKSHVYVNVSSHAIVPYVKSTLISLEVHVKFT